QRPDLARVRDERARALPQHAAGKRERHRPHAAVEQRGSRLALQLGDGQRHRWLAHSEAAGRRSHAAGRAYRQEYLQRPQLERKALAHGSPARLLHISDTYSANKRSLAYARRRRLAEGARGKPYAHTALLDLLG